jgi:hypothetical protein
LTSIPCRWERLGLNGRGLAPLVGHPRVRLLLLHDVRLVLLRGGHLDCVVGRTLGRARWVPPGICVFVFFCFVCVHPIPVHFLCGCEVGVCVSTGAAVPWALPAWVACVKRRREALGSWWAGIGACTLPARTTHPAYGFGFGRSGLFCSWDLQKTKKCRAGSEKGPCTRHPLSLFFFAFTFWGVSVFHFLGFVGVVWGSCWTSPCPRPSLFHGNPYSRLQPWGPFSCSAALRPGSSSCRRRRRFGVPHGLQ